MVLKNPDVLLADMRVQQEDDFTADEKDTGWHRENV